MSAKLQFISVSSRLFCHVEGVELVVGETPCWIEVYADEIGPGGCYQEGVYFLDDLAYKIMLLKNIGEEL